MPVVTNLPPGKRVWEVVRWLPEEEYPGTVKQDVNPKEACSCCRWYAQGKEVEEDSECYFWREAFTQERAWFHTVKRCGPGFLPKRYKTAQSFSD